MTGSPLELVDHPLPVPTWPGGAAAAVSVTFDVDGEASPLGLDQGYERRLSTLSAGRYGVSRGLSRVLDVLHEFQASATFYVPGYVAQAHPRSIEAIVTGGHEVGHHGFLHRRSHLLDPGGQERELDEGTRAIEVVAGRAPDGYRSPAWELTPETFHLLVDRGFRYDSSCMGDDRPYLQQVGAARLLELPVHWSLDDVPYLAFSPDAGGHLDGTAGLVGAWLEELGLAADERRHVTYTMHPELIGRGSAIGALRLLLTEIQERRLWLAPHRDVANLFDQASDTSTAPLRPGGTPQ
jgi:peptidoglycan/xylan/chitin deacetylase (PgdA/CDA1 family)